MVEPLTAVAGIGWGMKAAGWIASPIISELFKKASPYLGFDASKNLNELETKILLLEQVMEMVEESPHRDRLQRLFENLKSAFYEAEEILDDVEYHRLKKQIADTKMKPHSGTPPRKRDWVKKKLQSAMPSSLLKDQVFSCLDNLDTLEDSLKKKLHGKRFLLVLDDVWCSTGNVGEYEKLQKILTPLSAGEAGSKILVTSRSEDALRALGAVEQRRILIPTLDEDVFLELFMHYALPGAPIDDHVQGILVDMGKAIAKKLKGSPLAARTVGGQLRIRANVEFWRSVRVQDIFDETMGALWWSYRHLDEHARRCFVYCSIFPRTRSLKRDELVGLWAAAGFARSTNEGEDTEDACQKYFDDLVSASFLQLVVRKDSQQSDFFFKTFQQSDFYIVHDLLRDLAEKVAGTEHLRIENWIFFPAVEVPLDVSHVCHVFVQKYDPALITEKICKLKKLRTLIIDGEGSLPVEEKVLERMFLSLKKLRVLSIASSNGRRILSVPASIGQLRHLRYLAFLRPMKLVLPSTLSKLYHMQVLHFGSGTNLLLTSCEDWCDLINLRHVICSMDLKIRNIGRLTSLRTMEIYRVRKEQGYQLEQLRNLNKLGGKLCILGMENVESKVEALEAKLADKEGLRELQLQWNGKVSAEVKLCIRGMCGMENVESKALEAKLADKQGLRELQLQWNGEVSTDVKTEVLEGLCPPKHLDELVIGNYQGLRYPSWMVNKQNGDQKYLKCLMFSLSSQQLGPELRGFGTHLRKLVISFCSWVFLPDSIEHLTSLHDLIINGCENIRSLPTLPQSIKLFSLCHGNHVLTRSCKTIGDPSWQKIQHIPRAEIGCSVLIMGVLTEDLELSDVWSLSSYEHEADL